MHFANSSLPFGGCGESGLGAYHGKRYVMCVCGGGGGGGGGGGSGSGGGGVVVVVVVRGGV